jgi:hypothetical protein
MLSTPAKNQLKNCGQQQYNRTLNKYFSRDDIMKIKHNFFSALKFALGVAALTSLLAACSGGGGSSSGGGTVTGVSTPSKVSVVNTN